MCWSPPTRYAEFGITRLMGRAGYADLLSLWACPARRAEVLDAAYAANPERFRRRPKPLRMPTKAWINQPPTTIEAEEQPNKKTAA
jgi:hypothetical protein